MGLFLLISCKQTNEKKEQMVELKQQGFSTPDETTFKQRIKEVFQVDIDTYEESQQKFSGSLTEKENKDVKILIPRYGFIAESQKQPEVYIKERYINWIDPEEDSISLLNFNNYIFYKNDNAFEYLKSRKSIYLYNLIIDFGYQEDKRLVDFILEEIGDKFPKSENEDYPNIVFIGSKGLFGKYELRKDLVRKYFEKFPSSKLPYYSLAETILDKRNDEGYEYEGDRYENTAFLLEIQLEYSRDQLGTLINGGVDYILNKNPEFLEKLKENYAYNYPLLKDYIVFFQNEINTVVENNYAIIDPDGYTNLRKEKNTTSEVLQKINSGEHIEVLDNSSDWFLIKTEEGKQGYVHKSRIKSD